MLPCSFTESNITFGPPEGMTEDQVTSIRAFRGFGQVITCWKPTFDELAEIQKTGRVWLRVLGEVMPPVLITGLNPWREEDDGTQESEG